MKGPVKGTQIKGGRYYRVRAEGPKRVWIPLTLVKEGLPAFYQALARSLDAQAVDADAVPALIGDWERDVMARHAPKTQKDEKARGKVIAEAFSDFRAKDVRPPDVIDFLRPFKVKPRTHDLYRAQLRELMRYAEERGFREPGSNPVSALRAMNPKPRKRCPTTSELRRIKVGCLYGDDGKRTRSGVTMAALIELAYLSGQDISVMIRLRDKRDAQDPDEPHVSDEGIFFMRDKTGGAVVIEWTPRLRAVVAALRRLKAERALRKRAAQRVDTPYLFTKQDGTPLTYEAAANAWQRGLKRSGVAHCMFRDIRARALTDKEARDGIGAARAMGTHTTEAQTADYVRRKTARKTKATA
jgi:site-specific recombinase XerD